MTLAILAFRWGKKYGPEYVERLRKGVARHLSAPHRFICVTDDRRDLSKDTFSVAIPNPELLSVRDGCYARLRTFDPDWLGSLGVETAVWLDLDLIIVGALDPLFTGPEPFMVLRGGHFNPCFCNGSVLKVRRGTHPEVWSRFNVDEAERVAMADGTWRGSDQTWIAHMVPAAPGWTYREGIFAWRKPGWPNSDDLPSGARIVAFPGAADPAKLKHLPWIKANWAA
jgi:hypothetical protein